MIDSTLVFLVNRDKDRNIRNICLAMKKKGFGIGKYNGVGGRVEKGESVEQAAKRESREEINIDPLDLKKVANLEVIFEGKSLWDQMIHVFISEKWNGELKESDEMRPEWFEVSEIPYENMWKDDVFWLPKIISGDLIKGRFVFDKNDEIINKEIFVVKYI